MILQVNKVKKDTNTEKKTYEDYIEISSVTQTDEYVIANAKEGEIVLSQDKTFKESLDGYYNLENSHYGYEIDSVYLLDNTGKTIKKLL